MRWIIQRRAISADNLESRANELNFLDDDAAESIGGDALIDAEIRDADSAEVVPIVVRG